MRRRGGSRPHAGGYPRGAPLRSNSSAASTAPLGAPVLGWPTSRCSTASPVAASCAAAAATTSITWNGSTRERVEPDTVAGPSDERGTGGTHQTDQALALVRVEGP